MKATLGSWAGVRRIEEGENDAVTGLDILGRAASLFPQPDCCAHDDGDDDQHDDGS
jgi:hypothetical protein